MRDLTGWMVMQPDGLLLARVRRLLAVSAVVALVSWWPIWRQLMDPSGFHAPRLGWLTVSTPLLVGLGSGLILGAVMLVNRRLSGAGALLVALSVATAIAMDFQVVGGHFVVIVGLGIALALHQVMVSIPSLSRVAGAPLRVVRGLGPVVWGWAALGKINAVFLSGAVLRGSMQGGLVALPQWAMTREALRAAALGLVLLEALIAMGMIWPRTRRLAVAAALAIHLGIIVTLSRPLVFVAFGLTMSVTYLLLLGRWEPPRSTAGVEVTVR